MKELSKRLSALEKIQAEILKEAERNKPQAVIYPYSVYSDEWKILTTESGERAEFITNAVGVLSWVKANSSSKRIRMNWSYCLEWLAAQFVCGRISQNYTEDQRERFKQDYIDNDPDGCGVMFVKDADMLRYLTEMPENLLYVVNG